MKIDTGGVTANPLQPERGTRQPGTTTTVATQSTVGDRTTFSSSSATIQNLVTQTLATPDVRQDKVQALRQAVSSGTYQVDTQKLASAMLSDS